MKTLRRMICLTLAAVMCISLAGCGSSKDKTIKIGAVGPLTGDSSNGGTDELEGKQMAVEDFNEAGGVDGVMVELVSEDDASSASQSASAVTKLINQDGVVAIVGAHNSACTLADLEVINRYKIPMITPGSSAESVLTSGCKWISRAFPGDDLQCAALINYLMSTTSATKIGVIYSNDDFGQGGLNSLTEAAESYGLEVYSESFANEDKDMTTQLNNLKNEDVDALFIWCQYSPGALIMRQARELDWDVQFYSGTGTIHEDTFSLSDGAYVGCINSVPFISTSTDPQVQDFVKRYEEKYGTAPSQNSARAYDATMILLNAIKEAGSTDAEAIQEAIRNTKDYDGLQGNISINPETGEYEGDVMIVRATENNDWEYLDSASTVTQ
ncbi:MAG TPA: ABC transporter substrate-binding protein [Firmicutes bacterium]|nr:ABC transporter substrate-binding protein [Bacillota bacterium]